MAIKRRCSIDEMTALQSKSEKGFSRVKVQPCQQEKIDMSWWGEPQTLRFSTKSMLQNFHIENPDRIRQLTDRNVVHSFRTQDLKNIPEFVCFNYHLMVFHLKFFTSLESQTKTSSFTFIFLAFPSYSFFSHSCLPEDRKSFLHCLCINAYEAKS